MSALAPAPAPASIDEEKLRSNDPDAAADADLFLETTWAITRPVVFEGRGGWFMNVGMRTTGATQMQMQHRCFVPSQASQAGAVGTPSLIGVDASIDSSVVRIGWSLDVNGVNGDM